MDQESAPQTPVPSPSEGVPSPDQAAPPLDQAAPSPQNFQELVANLEALPDVERRLEQVIQFMGVTLTQKGSPHFRDFWEARKICLELFKEHLNPSLRVATWAQYSELCSEARRLKEIFDERSAFACEQIEIAIAAMEKELAELDCHLAAVDPIEITSHTRAIQQHAERYKTLQRELSLLNSHAVRTHALRKELVKTDMRIRAKNAFFERLTQLGNIIFPRRKALIEEVSALFIEDVEAFVSTTFASELSGAALAATRDEIKSLQGFAKGLTLSREAFSQTRLRLSECWDGIKHLMKEHRKVFSEQRALSKKQAEEFTREIEELQKSSASSHEVERKLEDIIRRMRETRLGKEEIRELRDRIRAFRQKQQTEQATKERERRQSELARGEARKRLFEDLKKRMLLAIEAVPASDVESCIAQYGTFTSEMSAPSFSRAEKQELERLLRRLKDAVAEKQERALFALSEGEQADLEELTHFLREQKARRKESKEQLESWRKASGASGLGFSQSIEYSDLIASEKERLERLEAGIKELEVRIARLSKRSSTREA